MAQMPVKPLIRLVDDEVDQLAALEMLLHSAAVSTYIMSFMMIPPLPVLTLVSA